jgi:hypothetical protein
MAVEQPDTLHTFVANESLIASQYHLVKIVCWSDVVNSPVVERCDVLGEKMCGILQNDPVSGDVAQVMRVGKSPAVIGAAIACQRSWTTDANGHVIGGSANQWIGGIAHEPGALSPTPTGHEKGTVDVECLNPWFTDDTFAEQ